jgi:hypothetical protein
MFVALAGWSWPNKFVASCESIFAIVGQRWTAGQFGFGKEKAKIEDVERAASLVAE